MTISFLKRVENDLSMLSIYIWTPNTFSQLVNCKLKFSYSIANLLSFIHFLFCLLDSNSSFVLSIFIIIPFSRHHILSRFEECCRLFSNVSLSKPISYNVVSSAYKSTDQIKSPINRGKSFISKQRHTGIALMRKVVESHWGRGLNKVYWPNICPRFCRCRNTKLV